MATLEDKFSALAKTLQGSEIRRLFAISMRSDVISFAGGLPDPDSFPSHKMAEVIDGLLKERGKVLLQYGPSRGIEEGIKAVMSRMQRRGIKVDVNEVIITSGAQQAIDLSAKVLADPGEIILVENPTFMGALGVFRNIGASLIGVPMDEKGIIPEELAEILEHAKDKGQRVKFLYTMPNFQNPTGITLTLERRREILNIAEHYDILIIEDDAYGELWFEGGLESVHPIKAIDSDGRGIYIGSFSKAISPGIRLGWEAAPQEIIERLDMARQMTDVCPNPLIQAAAAALCQDPLRQQRREDRLPGAAGRGLRPRAGGVPR